MGANLVIHVPISCEHGHGSLTIEFWVYVSRIPALHFIVLLHSGHCSSEFPMPTRELGLLCVREPLYLYLRSPSTTKTPEGENDKDKGNDTPDCTTCYGSDVGLARFIGVFGSRRWTGCLLGIIRRSVRGLCKGAY